MLSNGNKVSVGIMCFSKFSAVNGKEGKQLYSFDEKLALVENFNVKFVLKIDYNDEFKQIKPLEFLDILEEHLNVKAYMSGKDFPNPSRYTSSKSLSSPKVGRAP